MDTPLLTSIGPTATDGLVGNGINVNEIGSLSPDSSSLIDSLVDVIYKFARNFDKIRAANATAVALSGAMFVFIFFAIIFKRQVANRLSLRLICLTSLFYCLDCILTMYAPVNTFGACIARAFFASFFEFSGLYLTSAIMLNLHLVFLRKSTEPLPKYAPYLFFGIPLLIATLHQVPQYIYSGASGMCTFEMKYEPGSARFVLYNVFAVIVIPGVFIFYNLIVAIWLIVELCKRKRSVSRAIGQIAAANEQQQPGSLVSQEIVQLKAVRKVYNGAIRIVIYPLATLFWFTLRCAELGLENKVPKTPSDSSKLLNSLYVGTLAMPVFILASFLLFLADPVFCQLFSKCNSSIDYVDASQEIKAEEKNEIADNAVNSLKQDAVFAQVKNHEDAQDFFRTI
ncbi:hypothetical protein H4R99_000308 [Coemansia sp. RSA 1722]|nr:hypothetical protein LPJ57_002799 [Coemansia sp. RSA 486]KAJ2233885.1 hypothetical protein IWW45_003838 [Coemansia sp. RSA 485]KAJ2606476.1 hypothetical protein H4R99_000308 [Coemansia sp. RSA 1722]KAJ2638822.1 hypothetical protein GGF40_001363 [Coemansia sp. RSA 1286]